MHEHTRTHTHTHTQTHTHTKKPRRRRRYSGLRYRLDKIPGMGKNLSFLRSVQTDTGARKTFISMCPGGLFPGVKQSGCWLLTPQVEPRLRIIGGIFTLTHMPSWRAHRKLYFIWLHTPTQPTIFNKYHYTRRVVEMYRRLGRIYYIQPWSIKLSAPPPHQNAARWVYQWQAEVPREGKALN